jgi:hypothetical protein
VLHRYTLGPTSLEALGYSAAELADAQARGLTVTNQPALGSGLQRLAGKFFLGVTDRGPSFTVGSARFFPLPTFTPTIVLFEADEAQLFLEPTVLPLVGHSGAALRAFPIARPKTACHFSIPTRPCHSIPAAWTSKMSTSCRMGDTSCRRIQPVHRHRQSRRRSPATLHPGQQDAAWGRLSHQQHAAGCVEQSPR